MSTVMASLRCAARRLLRRPGFTLGAAGTLAFGIASVLVVWRLVDATLLRPLGGVAAPGELVTITSTVLSYPSFRDFQQEARPLAALAALSYRSLVLDDGRSAERVEGAVVSGEFFGVAGAELLAGRWLGVGDDADGAPPVAVASAALARTWGAPEAAVGRTVLLNGTTFTLVGVAGPRFHGLELAHAPAVYVPLRAWVAVAPTSFGRVDFEQRSWSWLRVVGRLRGGIERAQLEAALNVSAARQMAVYPNETREDFKVTVSPASVAAVGVKPLAAVRLFAMMLAGAAVLVLLLACANVAGLLLARVESRRREIATRLALGSGRQQAANEVLGEAFLLAMLGAALGLLAVLGAGAVLGAVELAGGVTLGRLGLNVGAGLGPPVLLIATAFAILAALLCATLAAVPVVRSTARDMSSALKGAAAGGGPPSRLGGALAAVQIALCLVLVLGAGLFARAAGRALALDSGMATDNLALATVDFGLARWDAARAAQGYESARQAVTALAGVEQADWLSSIPLTADQNTESLTVPGYQPAPGEQPEVEINVVGAGMFEVLGIPLIAGRAFSAQDGSDSAQVAIVNQAFVRRYFADRDPLGVEVELVGSSARIVGIVRDARLHDLVTPPEPILYRPLLAQIASAGLRSMTVVVRTSGEPRRLLPAIERALRTSLPGVPIYEVGTFDDIYADLLLPQRFAAGALGLLSLLGLALAASGVFALVSFAAARRLRDLGIRAALGAAPLDLMRVLVGEGLKPALYGILGGVVLAAFAAPTLRSWLYGLEPLDPVAFLVPSIILLAAAAVASFLPARRASRIDPAKVLREG